MYWWQLVNLKFVSSKHLFFLVFLFVLLLLLICLSTRFAHSLSCIFCSCISFVFAQVFRHIRNWVSTWDEDDWKSFMLCGSVDFGFSNCPILFIATLYIHCMYVYVSVGFYMCMCTAVSLALSVYAAGFSRSALGMEFFDWFYVLIAYSECRVKRQIYCLGLCPHSMVSLLSLLRDQMQSNTRNCFCSLSLIWFEYTQIVFCNMACKKIFKFVVST